MAVQKIDYENKIGLQNDENVPNKNKVTDEDMNQIKSKVNNNADELSTAQQNIEDLQEGQGTASSEITSLENRVTTLEKDNTKNKQDIANKVDKVEGKGLSTEDYTTAEKEKLAGLSNYNDTEIKQDIQELQSKNEEQDKKIETIEAEQESQNDLLQRTQNALINITTPKSSNINVKDSSYLNAKIDVFGISKQETRSGKNKFNIEKLTGTNITDKDSKTGAFKMSNCWGIIVMDNASLQEILKPNTQYKCIADVTLLSKPDDLNASNSSQILSLYNNQDVVVVNMLFTSNKQEKDNWEVNTKKHLSTTFTTPADLTGFSMIGYNYRTERATNEGSFKFENIMILEATEDDESFEQYGASPSPKYPSEIENAGDNINLFNKETVGNNTYIDASNGQVQSYTGSSSSDYINVKNLKSVILSGDTIARDNGGAFYNSEKVYISGFTTNQIWSGIDIPETANYVRVTVTTANLDKIKLEKGKKATSYSNYGCGNIDITVCNKNLANLEIVSNQFNVTTEKINANTFKITRTANTSSSYGQVEMNLDANKTYTVFVKISGENTTGACITLWKGYNGNGTYSGSFTNYKTIQTTQDLLIIGLYPNQSNNLSGLETTFEIMIIEGNNINEDFVPYEQQTITFPLSEGQKLYDKDYPASDGIHHVRKQIELDGTENWGVIYENIFWIEFSDTKLFTSAIMTHFKYAKKSLTELLDNEFTTSVGQGHAFWTKKEGMTLEEFKSFLSQQKQAGIPVIVEYELETEEIEAYTEEQQEAYDQLQNVLSYKTETNVFTDKAQLVFKYIADTQTWAINLVKNEIANTNQQLLNIAGGN